MGAKILSKIASRSPRLRGYKSGVALDTDDLQPVYVLVSAEPLLLDRALTALRDAVVPEALRAFNLDVIEGRGATASRILGAARTMPMMAERRLVLVREIPAMTASEMAGLVEYLAAPNPSTVLVATASKVDKRLKFFAAAGKKGWLEELSAPRDLAGWVTGEAARRTVAIRPDAVRRLVDAVGADLSRLALALEQLALYAGDRPIAVDDVDDLVADTRERSVFELTDAIGAADRPRALGAVAALVDQRQSPIGVVAMLARHVRQLSLYRAGRQSGMGKSELGRLLGVPPFVVDKLGRQADRFADRALDRAIAALSLTDRALKGEGEASKTLGRGLTDRLLLEDVVQRLVDLGSRR
jgi:DNA polymerase-3 subunit delta